MVVETHYGTFGEPTPLLEQFKKVFGDAWWTWPFPVAAALKVDYDEPVYRSTAGDGSRDDFEEVTYRPRLHGDDLAMLGISEEDRVYTAALRREAAARAAGRRADGTARHRSDTPPPRPC